MIIKRALIKAFGKFNQVNFEFFEGLHLIQGLNEAGKTTIHAFIEAMFYGFIDPSKSRRIFLEDYDRYLPIDEKLYGGALIIELEGKEYRIERSLNKTQVWVKVFIESTGEEITHTLDSDPISRTVDISKWIKIPYVVYKNTLSIRQLTHETEASIGKELVNRLKNLTTTKTESISADKALLSLNKQLEELGTKRASTKPYALALQKESVLEEELKIALKYHEEILKTMQELNTKKSEFETLSADIKTFQNDYELIENARKKEQYFQVKTLEDKLKEIKGVLNHLFPYQIFNQTDLQTHALILQRQDDLKLSIQKKETTLTNISQSLKEKKEETSPLTSYKTMKEDRDKLLKASRKVQELNTQKNTQYETLMQSIDELNEAINQRNKHMKNLLFFSLLILPLLIVLTLYILNKNAINKRNSLMINCDQETLKHQELNQQIIPHQSIIDTVLNTYQCSNIEMFEDSYELRFEAQENLQKIENMHTLYHQTEKELNALKETLQVTHKSLIDLYTRYQVKTSDEFLEYTKKHQEYKQLEQEYLIYEKTFKDKIGSFSLEKLAASINFEAKDIKKEEFDLITKRYETAKNNLSKVHIDIEKLQHTLTHQHSLYRECDLIHYDLEQVKNQLMHMTQKKLTLEKAITRIQNAIDQIEQHFAPVLSEEIAKYLKTLTLSRYETIKIRKDLSFRILAQNSGRLEKKSYFSSGTLDQIYLAIRLGILDALKQNESPLFLDDVFASTDSIRLKAALHMLKTQALKRQIILMSCHEREKEILTNEQIPHEMTTLN